MDTKPIIIDATIHAEIVQSLSEKLKAYYVFPDIAEQICLSLQKHLEAGEYTDITQGELLASVLTIHIQEVNQDKHLIVRWYPEPLPDCNGPMQHNQEWLDEWHQRAEFDNFGFHKVERMPGNVGYLDICEFYYPSWGGDTAIAAMNFLASTNVLIVDLRQCRGGDPDMVAMICSYVFGDKRVHLNSFYWREQDITEQYWTLPYFPAKYFGDKPVYVLISKDTFSGGEEFAYDLKTRQRAILVGETTRGGAHPGSPYRVHAHFDVFIPNGRPINPITGTNWEGSGVTPDIPTPQAQALMVAYHMALESIIGGLGEVTSSPSNLLKEEAQVALKNLDAS
jgi:retinol-binding protein 3